MIGVLRAALSSAENLVGTSSMYLPGDRKGLSWCCDGIWRGGDTGLSCERSPCCLENRRRLMEAPYSKPILVLLPFPWPGVVRAVGVRTLSSCCGLGIWPPWLEMLLSTLREDLMIYCQCNVDHKRNRWTCSALLENLPTGIVSTDWASGSIYVY